MGTHNFDFPDLAKKNSLWFTRTWCESWVHTFGSKLYRSICTGDLGRSGRGCWRWSPFRRSAGRRTWLRRRAEPVLPAVSFGGRKTRVAAATAATVHVVAAVTRTLDRLRRYCRWSMTRASTAGKPTRRRTTAAASRTGWSVPNWIGTTLRSSDDRRRCPQPLTWTRVRREATGHSSAPDGFSADSVFRTCNRIRDTRIFFRLWKVVFMCYNHTVKTRGFRRFFWTWFIKGGIKKKW